MASGGGFGIVDTVYCILDDPLEGRRSEADTCCLLLVVLVGNQQVINIFDIRCKNYVLMND